MGPRPLDSACYWLALHPPKKGYPKVLDGKAKADIVIVGGGFTGLWTAIHLSLLEPKLRIVLLERERIAYGASGRNAGMLSPSIDHSHALAIQHFGVKEARTLAALGRSNIEDIVRFLQKHDIDCDLERTGILTAALSEEHAESLKESLAAAKEVGVKGTRLLDREEMQREIRSPLYHGALFDPGGAVLDPVKLALGLARVAKKMGVTIYEGSLVTDIEEDATQVRVHTDDGEVQASTCILGTSAYTHTLLPNVGLFFMPLYDYVITSEPLTAAQKKKIGWQNRQGVNDCRAFFNYYRLTKDGRVLWGTSEAAYYPPNRVDGECDHSERHYAGLRESFAAHFPELSELKFPYAWGGAICATTRFTPFFGRAGRILYGLGFTGHGLCTTHLAGRILAHMALHRASPLLELRLVREAPAPFPPEPVRRWAVKYVWEALKRVDEGAEPSFLLRCLDAFGVGLSS